MKYKRMPIEIEAPEGLGYNTIDCNLSESSFSDQRLSDLGIDVGNLLLVYGDHKGKPELRDVIAREASVHADDVLITAGAASALFIVATSVLEQGDHIVIAKANYATNLETPRTIGARISYLDMRFEDGYTLNFQELEQLITADTKLVSLTYPHNPTGAVISVDELQKLIDLIERKKTHLLLDETYRDMSFGSVPPLAASLSSRVISISSMSKSYGLPGIRIGWIVCQNKKLMETLLAAKEQIFITNSVIDEAIAFEYLRHKSRHFPLVKEKILNNFLVLKNFMKNQSYLEWVEPKGGCVAFVRIKKEVEIDPVKFHQVLLDKYQTYVGRGRWFEEDDRYFRIGYSWDTTEKLKKGLDNILKTIDAVKG